RHGSRATEARPGDEGCRQRCRGGERARVSPQTAACSEGAWAVAAAKVALSDRAVQPSGWAVLSTGGFYRGDTAARIQPDAKVQRDSVSPFPAGDSAKHLDLFFAMDEIHDHDVPAALCWRTWASASGTFTPSRAPSDSPRRCRA